MTNQEYFIDDCETGTECGECGECNNCSNRKEVANNIKCKCLELATTAKTCPYYVEDK